MTKLTFCNWIRVFTHCLFHFHSMYGCGDRIGCLDCDTKEVK